MKKVFCILLISLFLPSFAFSDESTNNPVGRWTILSDYSEMVSNFLYSKTDFLFFEDGSVYRLSVKRDKHENDISISSASGIWLGDSDSIVVRFDDKTYKCSIDSDGFLLLFLGAEAHLTFSRVSK